MLNDEIKSNILSSLYLQFIDTQGSKYMMIMMWSVQVLQSKNEYGLYLQMLQCVTPDNSQEPQYTIASKR